MSRKHSLLTVAAMIGMCAAVAPALAQASAVPTSVWEVVFPIVSSVVGVIATVFIPWLAYRLVGMLNIQDESKKKALEAQIAAALHQAAENGLKYAMSKLGYVPQAGVPIPDYILAEAAKYVRDKNPNTAAEAGVSDQGLKEIILSKVPNVLGTIVTAAAGPLAGNLAGGLASAIAEGVSKGVSDSGAPAAAAAKAKADTQSDNRSPGR